MIEGTGDDGDIVPPGNQVLGEVVMSRSSGPVGRNGVVIDYPDVHEPASPYNSPALRRAGLSCGRCRMVDVGTAADLVRDRCPLRGIPLGSHHPWAHRRVCSPRAFADPIQVQLTVPERVMAGTTSPSMLGPQVATGNTILVLSGRVSSFETDAKAAVRGSPWCVESPHRRR